MNFNFIWVVILCYIIGSFPTAWLVGKVFRGRSYDIRHHGSGNSGATNVYRNLGKKAGFITLLLDAFKGFAVVKWLPSLYTGSMEIGLLTIILATVSLIGHTFPLFIRFKGGKGVATTLGIMIAFSPFYALGSAVFFFTLLFTTKQAGMGSIAGAIGFPISVLLFRAIFNMPADVYLVWFSCLLPIFIIITHISNIKKFAKGEYKKDL